MGYLQSLRQKNAFIPGIGGVFLNPAYLIRRTLAESIRISAETVRGSVLDFGCGSKPYESLFRVDEYIGLDIEVSGHPPGGKSPDIYYDGKHIPLEDASVDHVFSAEVFEHVFNAPELFREIHRVLKPGGTLIMTCPFVWPLHEEPYDFARYTPYALTYFLTDSGYASVTAEKHGHPAEVICQLSLEYLCQLVPRIPLAGGALGMLLCGLFNVTGRVAARILPNNGKLYLSNLVIATK